MDKQVSVMKMNLLWIRMDQVVISSSNLGSGGKKARRRSTVEVLRGTQVEAILVEGWIWVGVF